MKKSKITNKQQNWKHHVKQWEASGLSVRAYCLKNKIAIHNMYYWKKKLSKQNTQCQELALFPLDQVLLSPPLANLSVSVDRHKVEVSEDTEPVFLEELIVAFELFNAAR